MIQINAPKIHFGALLKSLVFLLNPVDINLQSLLRHFVRKVQDIECQP